MASLLDPATLGLPREAVVAVPANGLDVYRLVRSATPKPADFAPVPPARAATRGAPELLRLGISFYLEPWQAEAVRLRPSSRVVRVTLRAGRRIHVARTGARPGHVTVWAPLEELLDSADLVK